MIYFDNSATTKPYKEVLDTFIQVNEHFYANPASIHEAGVEANELLDRARSQVAQILKTDDYSVLFTGGGTESNNFAIFGVTKANTHKGKHIITTEIEHASILESVKSLEKEGFEVDYLQVDENGVISLEELKKKIRKDTVFVSIMHVNNEIGSIQPIQEAGKIIHENSRATFHVDAVQSFGKLPIFFNGEAGPDIISISGHKIHGLKGSGIIAFRQKINILPYLLGGGQEFGLRSGTVAVPQAVALSKAARIAAEKIEETQAKYKKWHQDLIQFLSKFGEEVKILSTEFGAGHILSFSVKDLKGEILINALQQRGIIVSTSSACSSKQKKTSHVVTAMNVEKHYKDGVIRLSFGAFNTEVEINQFKIEFMKVMKELKGVNL
ncbi:aminotransferase class V [Ureibacillus massiliensis 4400831 = CIP 108448 = CCUG 49529]|uniref:Aminotransferase class V n=1 Tax=Ureibacillus massiliensis 4400831 = CIP 108448 = CCUG 49529 TaxID=1211035 RepID=A0A0A3J7J6_9BACL|nr:cysteine desulfurase family protein [Ureibacillus massiliensis]KGR91153.1 aminotransferase class V [Ureibacillus massiliensis 4400831 = CIP 108448 = CCUG 49529]